MSRYPQQYNQANMKPRRKRFADGSAVVTYPDGSRLILESALAKSAVLCEGGPVSYSQSPRRAHDEPRCKAWISDWRTRLCSSDPISPRRLVKVSKFRGLLNCAAGL
ncbi:MAG: hypothetical protein ABR955_15815 [Verrucomicrobiota bacterium]